VTGNFGKNSKKTIAGGDVRVFSVKLETEAVEENRKYYRFQIRKQRAYPSEYCFGERRDPSAANLFQHFDRVVIDWK
jgi:hypothetical protein